jgi:hypothetical protein
MWQKVFTNLCGYGAEESALELYVTGYSNGRLYIKVLFTQSLYCYYTWDGSVAVNRCDEVTNLQLTYNASESFHAGIDGAGHFCCINTGGTQLVRCYVTAG